MNERVGVVIVTWNGWNWLEHCLPGVIRQEGVIGEIVIVDNGSHDGTIENLRLHYPTIRVIANATNLGFAKANNQGFDALSTPWIATLNNDTEIDPNWLTSLVSTAQMYNAGMVASLMVRMDEPAIIDSAGIAPDRFGFGWNLLADQPAERAIDQHEVFGPCAGAALYRKELLTQLGGFDERFESFYEDVDLAWRARLNGWSCRLSTQSPVRHAHSATGKRFPNRKKYLLARNQIWTYVKNQPSLVTSFAGWAALSIVSSLRSSASMRGRLDAIRGIGPVLLARKQIQSRSSVKWDTVRSLLAPFGGGHMSARRPTTNSTVP